MIAYRCSEQYGPSINCSDDCDFQVYFGAFLDALKLSEQTVSSLLTGSFPTTRSNELVVALDFGSSGTLQSVADSMLSEFGAFSSLWGLRLARRWSDFGN